MTKQLCLGDVIDILSDIQKNASNDLSALADMSIDTLINVKLWSEDFLDNMRRHKRPKGKDRTHTCTCWCAHGGAQAPVANCPIWGGRDTGWYNWALAARVSEICEELHWSSMMLKVEQWCMFLTSPNSCFWWTCVGHARQTQADSNSENVVFETRDLAPCGCLCWHTQPTCRQAN